MKPLENWIESSEIQKALLTSLIGGSVAHQDQISLCACIPGSEGTVKFGGVRAEIPVYPASVVKLFHLVYTLQLISQVRLIFSPELKRALTDMIHESCNDATSLVVDTYSGVLSGPELSPESLEAWIHQREIIDRWFEDLGYANLIVSQKTWNERPYGRERQARGPLLQHRNAISPFAALRLMESIRSGECGLSSECATLASDILGRLNPAESAEADSQSREYIGGCLPRGWKLWSKAGWTDEVRHDVAWLQSPRGKEIGLSIFTVGVSQDATIIPQCAHSILSSLDFL